MNPTLAPPAPPPMQPVTPDSNPYEFITQSPTLGKRSLIPGSSKKHRIIVVIIFLIVLSVIASTVIGLISASSKGPKDDYQTLLEQQTELIRVSAIGINKAQLTEAKNLAYTINYSLTSEQATLLRLAKKNGALTDAKNLAASKNNQTDTLLTTGTQTNQFDTVFIKTMQDGLKKYQSELKKIYDETTNKTTRDILSKDYTNANILLGNPAP